MRITYCLAFGKRDDNGKHKATPRQKYRFLLDFAYNITGHVTEEEQNTRYPSECVNIWQAGRSWKRSSNLSVRSKVSYVPSFIKNISMKSLMLLCDHKTEKPFRFLNNDNFHKQIRMHRNSCWWNLSYRGSRETHTHTHTHFTTPLYFPNSQAQPTARNISHINSPLRSIMN